MSLILAALLAIQDSPNAEQETAADWGHSSHGAAYDVGPRSRPWSMDGIGSVHLPVTSTSPEVQAWFDQGLAHLHGFWWYEAERAFRWCLKLDPECAMAYWGLARAAAASDSERAAEFLAEASARIEGLSPLERALIEVEQDLAAYLALEEDDEADDDQLESAKEVLALSLDLMLLEHPDEVEAKAMHWVVTSELSDEAGRFGREAVLQQGLALDPEHVGLLHYRVHNWDGDEGQYAIDSCRALTEIAPGSGHLQHMPGHVLSSIGMWHEAAIAMDSATRVEKAYMHAHAVLPEDNWDYLHNLDYLTYIQSQLGMYEAAQLGAEQFLIAPPPSNVPPKIAPFVSMIPRISLIRTWTGAGDWEAILDGDLLGWPEQAPPPVAMFRAAAEARAALALGDLDTAEARNAELEELKAAMPDGGPMPGLPFGSVDGLLLIARGERLAGIQALTEYAERQEEDWRNDPPVEGEFGFNVLGEVLLELGSPALAADAFERTLETVFHDGVALAGLVRAYHAIGEAELASAAMAALEVVWSEADPNNERLAAARATGVVPADGDLPARFAQAMEQRAYGATVLEPLGHSLYEPSPAPHLAALDVDGREVTLANYAGQNVILIFYLGEQCLHCIEQLQLARDHADALAELDTVVLAVSKDSVEHLGGYQEDFPFPLLSDPDFDNARRFGSYDDFEELELHSTTLIDARGRLHWARRGGDPYTDFEFLLDEVARLDEQGVIGRLRQP